MAILIVEVAMDFRAPGLEVVVKPAVDRRFAAHKWAAETEPKP